MTTKPVVEIVARAIAEANGDDFDAVPRDKSHWNRERGMFAGRARDINEPMQGDYIAMAEGACAALAAAEDQS